MCSWWILYTLIPIFIGISLTQYKSDILKLVRHQIFSAGDSHALEVVVYVPSARNNFERRETIRKTWWHYVQKNDSLNSRVTLKFVVGKHSCPISDEDKADIYSCNEWIWPEVSQINNRSRRAVNIELIEEQNDSDHVDVRAVQSIKFIVHHPILLTKLGVHDSCRATRTSVKLLEATTSKEIVHVTFDAKPTIQKSWKLSAGNRSERFRYQKIHTPYLLPKGYRGEIVVDNLESGSSRCNFPSWNFPWKTSLNSSNVIEFLEDDRIPSGHHKDEEDWKSRRVHLLNFAFLIHDREELVQRVQSRSERQKEVEQNMTKESEALERESVKRNDLVFVDVVDVYRNLPRKLLLFSQWAKINMDFKFLLKTDDDCYLDIARILDMLDTLPSSNNTWFGNFRYNWRLDRFGKWAENVYTSPIYPRFACGSGYVLSRDIVKWLSRNSRHLKAYQGEDISLGIWLSAIDPLVVDEPLWSCEKECLSDMFSMPDLGSDEMETYWSRRVKCGDPCGCD